MLKKSSKRFVSIVLAIAMILTMVPFAAFADETTASDLDGHWAENVITEWMDYGIINGYEDGTIRPNNKITRAEMTAMLDRVMDYQTKADNTFSDLQDTWYTDVILKANAAGVISGYPDGTVKPDATITRQEAVAMFSRVLSLDTKNAPEATFTDNADVADWAKDAVNAMAAADYIHGSDGQFRPNDGITRAEVVTILNNIFDKLYQKAGEYTGDVDGSAVINTDQVTLKDMTISGDLIIAEGVGDGHVVLDNVTVDGKLIVRGGGENSVIIKGDSKIDNISVERIDGAVRVAVEGNASVNAVLIDNGGQDVKIEGTIDTVNVASANVNVDITGAVKDINVAEEAHDATITLTKSATVDNVSTNAENTTIIVAGTVSNIDIAVTANNSVVTTQSSATIDKVTTAAGNTTIEGSGTVTDVVVSESASDATVTTEGTKVENNSSSNVTTSDDSVIAPGTTDTTPGGTTETPSVPSVPSVPSGPSHTHNYVDGVCAADDAIDPAWAQVNSTATWNEAVEAGKNIVVTADFTTNAQLQITKAITVNGNGHTITAANDWTGTANENKHLLSVIGDDANNVAVKNLTLDSKNAAYGAQAYCVEGTTLTNVTLKNSNGAGLTVNGSTVTANSLTTTGNAWGGVNVDKGSGVEANTIFTFDATSTFAEDAEVYSDAGNVTVNAPEGWACAQVSGKYIWTKLFEGGNGSEEKPYLISTAEQFKAIDNIASAEKIYYQLTNSFTVTREDAYTDGAFYAVLKELSNCVLDGNGNTITVDDSSGMLNLIYTVNEATIKNLKVILDYSLSVECSATTFNDVDVLGAFEVTGNEGAYIIYATPLTPGENHSTNGLTTYSTTINFENCDANVQMIGSGETKNYNAVFVGYAMYYNLTDGSHHCYENLNFTNCTNEGILICGKASMFLGNVPSEYAHPTITVNNCSNNGLIQATIVSNNDPDKYADDSMYSHFVSSNARLATVVKDGAAGQTGDALAASSLTMDCGEKGSFVHGPNDSSLTLTKNSDGTFTITPASTPGVAYYEVEVGLYTTLIAGGTNRFYAKERINANNSSLTTTLKYLNFVDEQWVTANSSSAQAGTLAGNTIYTLNDTSYYYIGDESTGSTLNGTSKAPQMISVSAYDANGKLLASAALSN